MARFYLAVVQAKLLYGAETWVLSQSLLRRLESFHARCARTLAHRPIHRNADGTWEHPHTDEVLERCGLSPISTYIAKRKTRLLLGPRCSIALRVLGRKTFLVKAHRIVPVVAFDCEVLRSTKGSPILAAHFFSTQILRLYFRCFLRVRQKRCFWHVSRDDARRELHPTRR
jgi:hypothetical protein